MTDYITTKAELLEILDTVPLCQKFTLKGHASPRWFCPQHRCFWYEFRVGSDEPNYVNRTFWWRVVGPEEVAQHCADELARHRDWVYLTEFWTGGLDVLPIQKSDITKEDVLAITSVSEKV